MASHRRRRARAFRHPSPAGDPSVHGELGCTATWRYRCVLCWQRICWCKGADDAVERGIEAHVNQETFQDRGLGRRPRKHVVTDVGLCDDCWAGLGAGDLVVRDALADSAIS